MANAAEKQYTGAVSPVTSKSSSISTAKISIVPSARLLALARTYQVMGSFSAQSATPVLASVTKGAALRPSAKSSSGVPLASPLTLSWMFRTV